MTLNRRRAALAAAVATTVLLAGTACSAGGGESDDEIVIGVLSPSEGSLADGGEDARRTTDMALAEFDGEIGGKTIKLVYEGTDGTSGSAQTKLKKLVENDDVDIVLGPASGDEGETMVEYAKTVPEVTFVNGAASPVGMTLADVDNVFRFMGDSVQWMGGLGDYALNEKGYETVYSIAEDYSFPYDNAGGFLSGYCEAGGEVVGNSWVPVGTTDYATIIDIIPKDVDAVYVGLGGSDAASFLSQAVTSGLNAPLVGGSITIDPTALGGEADVKDAAVGMISGGPVPGQGYENPEWDKFLEAYSETEGAFPSPSIFGLLYYNAFKSLLLGLEEVEGDLGDDQMALRTALSSLTWESPTGELKLDDNRQGIVDNFITEVIEGDDGSLTTATISEAKGVQQGTIEYDRFDGCP